MVNPGDYFGLYLFWRQNLSYEAVASVLAEVEIPEYKPAEKVATRDSYDINKASESIR